MQRKSIFTSLSLSVLNNNIAGVKSCLSSKRYDKTDLHFALITALRKRHLKIADLLVSAGADPNPLLKYAVEEKYPDIKLIKYLISSGADPKPIESYYIGRKYQFKSNPSHADECLWTFAERGDIHGLGYAIKSGANISDGKALKWAMCFYSVKPVLFLLKHGADPKHLTQDDLMALFLKAIDTNDYKSAEYLRLNVLSESLINSARFYKYIDDELQNAINNHNTKLARYLVTIGADKDIYTTFMERETLKKKYYFKDEE